MVSGFTRQDEGVKEYEKIGQPYPNNLDDENYENWLKKTSAEDLAKYTHRKEREVSAITVHQIGTDENDKKNMYITYAFQHNRLDVACNVVSWYRSGIGRYPIPRAHYRVTNQDFGKQTREVDYIEGIETAYNIKWTKANLQKIANIGLDAEGKISYSVVVPNGIRISVATFNDLLNGSYEELVHFGKIPSKQQRQKWLQDEGGREADLQRLADTARMKSEGSIPESPVTTSEVRKLIKQEAST